jgi:hypothetical protein
MYGDVRRPCTVAHGLQSVRKEKGKNSLKALYGTHVQHGGVKEKKRKEKNEKRSRIKDKNEIRTYDIAFNRQTLAQLR